MDNMQVTPSKANILIVDDTPANLRLLTGILAEHNYKVRAAPNGELALKAIQSTLPDLILLDIKMPGMDGYGVCVQLKANERTRDIPIIFLSSLNETMDKLKAFSVGGVDYVTKPFQSVEVLARVETHIRLKEANNLLKNQAEILEQQVQERTRQLSLMNESLARFVPDEFLHFLRKESITEINLGDHVSKEMAVLFSDIRSFITLSETMTPQQNFNFVNAYFAKVSPIIREHGGMIVKYLGDGVMAIFPNSANNAVQAGIAKLKRVAAYNRDRQQEGREPIQVGIGVHFGHMMFGMVGEAHRMQGDAFSDNVNLTARIESATKDYGVSLIISEAIYHQIDASQYHIRFLDYVTLKGKIHPISIYEVCDADPEDLLERKLKTKALLEEGQQHYFAREFAAAVKCFTDVLTIIPEDVTTRYYHKQSSTCLLEGVPDDWQGVHTMDKK